MHYANYFIPTTCSEQYSGLAETTEKAKGELAGHCSQEAGSDGPKAP